MKTNSVKPSIPKTEIAEKAAISIILQNYATLDATTWDEDMFFSHANKVLFNAAKKLHEQGQPSDLFKLQAYLESNGGLDEVGGYQGVTEAFTLYPVGDVYSALEFRTEMVKSRKYRKVLQTLDKSRNDILEMRADLAQLAQAFSESETEPKPQSTIKKQCEDLLNFLESKTPPIRLKTGIRNLDSVLGGGFEKPSVIVFASETSGGKSIALLQVALSATQENFRGIIFSLEMSSNQILSRFVSCKSGERCLPLYSNPTKQQATATFKAISEIANLPLTIFDSITEIDVIESICKTQPCDFIVVDYIQLCSSASAETREQQVSEIVRRLKIISNKYNICVLTASQLNDSGELRESRAIGHHADYVLHIDHSDHPDCLMRVMKNRNGERFVTAPVTMNGAISRFVDR